VNIETISAPSQGFEETVALTKGLYVQSFWIYSKALRFMGCMAYTESWLHKPAMMELKMRITPFRAKNERTWIVLSVPLPGAI
jgi:hypothetical protein